MEWGHTKAFDKTKRAWSLQLKDIVSLFGYEQSEPGGTKHEHGENIQKSKELITQAELEAMKL